MRRSTSICDSRRADGVIICLAAVISVAVEVFSVLDWFCSFSFQDTRVNRGLSSLDIGL